MHTITVWLSTILFLNVNVICDGDFYVGMLKDSDQIVSNARVFKDRVPYRISYAMFGRIFKCPITYISVEDRLKFGKSPQVQIVRGGLRKYYVVLRLSVYNKPIAVNINIGCPPRTSDDPLVPNVLPNNVPSNTKKPGDATSAHNANNTKKIVPLHGPPGTSAKPDHHVTDQNNKASSGSVNSPASHDAGHDPTGAGPAGPATGATNPPADHGTGGAGTTEHGTEPPAAETTVAEPTPPA